MIGWGVVVAIMTTAAAAMSNRKGAAVASRGVAPPPTTPAAAATEQLPHHHHHRPALVTQALERNQPLYYFGLGSNMLRSKLENRGINGTKIEIQEMQPAVVPGYRLAFNMRGFAPLEPGMGSLEPVNSSSRPLACYDRPECHGALVTLSADNYEKVMASEGVTNSSSNAGYEEIVVEAYPYGGAAGNSKPVQAIALRARPHVRLNQDPSPSLRYMTILRQGAAQLQLKPCYRQFLDDHPVQHVPSWLRQLAIRNLIAMFTVSSTLKWRGLSKLQSWLIFCFYAPSNAPALRRVVSDVASGGILLPGALVGAAIQMYYQTTQKNFPPFLKRFLTMLEASEQQAKQQEEPAVQANDASVVR